MNFGWHEFARVWQTPGAGEEFFEDQLAPDFHSVAAPGLVVVPSDDPFLSPGGARTAAARAGAAVAELSGLGHWWMLQDPARGAAVLQDFWASLA